MRLFARPGGVYLVKRYGVHIQDPPTPARMWVKNGRNKKEWCKVCGCEIEPGDAYFESISTDGPGAYCLGCTDFLPARYWSEKSEHFHRPVKAQKRLRHNP